jgi:UDP-N-acetylmuramoyl-tripeptide--D-alanyl-D-alanine ligase
MVAAALAADPPGPCPEEGFAGVSTDTRTLAPGELFVALAGPSFDGHDFVAAALAAGAGGAVVREGFADPALERACLFRVADPRRALGDLAAAWRREHSALVAAVTGSNGKTTTKEMLAAILGRRHRVLKNAGNLNNDIGLPLTLLGLEAGHTACVLEMGMNAAGEIARLTEIAAPEAGVVTNVGPAHLGRLGSLEAVARAKTELFRGLGPAAAAVVNLDDPLLAPWAEKLDCRVVTFGSAPAAQVRVSGISGLGSRTAFTLALPGAEPVRVRLAAAGRHNALNAAAAAATAWALGQGPEEAAAGLEEFRPVKGRLGVARSFWGWTVLDDTYNANPASLAAGLGALDDLAAGRRRVLILGDMRELGPEAESLHRRAGRLAAESGCALVLAVGRRAPAVAAGAREAGLGPEAALAFEAWEELVWRARELLGEEDVVLVKGSRSARMERVAAALTTGEMG